MEYVLVMHQLPVNGSTPACFCNQESGPNGAKRPSTGLTELAVSVINHATVVATTSTIERIYLAR